MDSKHIVQLTTDELRQLIREELETLKVAANSEKNDEPLSELMSRKEVADYFGVSLVTLNKWVKKGVLPEPIKRGKRVFFRLSDLKTNVNEGHGEGE